MHLQRAGTNRWDVGRAWDGSSHIELRPPVPVRENSMADCRWPAAAAKTPFNTVFHTLSRFFFFPFSPPCSDWPWNMRLPFRTLCRAKKAAAAAAAQFDILNMKPINCKADATVVLISHTIYITGGVRYLSSLFLSVIYK